MNSPFPELWTSRYQNQDRIIASGLVPVRITAGHPRFRLRYQLGGAVIQLAPTRDMFDLEPKEFRARYFARLEEHQETWTSRLRELSEDHDGRGLVLLCFEDLTKPGLWCHRTMLAEFIERAAVRVPELS